MEDRSTVQTVESCKISNNVTCFKFWSEMSDFLQPLAFIFLKFAQKIHGTLNLIFW